MNPRLIRILIVVIAIAIGLTTGYYLQKIDADMNARRVSADALREQAAALSATIADVRAGQFAYVARGRSTGWTMVTRLLRRRRKSGCLANRAHSFWFQSRR